MASIIYSPKDIFEQEFKTSMRGYDKKEVDEFLDDIIRHVPGPRVDMQLAAVRLVVCPVGDDISCARGIRNTA